MVKLLALFFAIFFLSGSTILPLGDFSLMTDLPEMYRSYSKIVAEKPDFIDFIGDYIWGGKDLLGHNKNDAPLKANGNIQFQHIANSICIVMIQPFINIYLPVHHLTKSCTFYTMLVTKGYYSDFFKPPHA